MFDSRAARLLDQALEALSDLRTWIWGHHSALLPDDLGSITREEAERYASYLDWYSRVEEVILALAASSAQATEASSTAAAAAEPAPGELGRAQLAAGLAPVEDPLLVPTVRAPASHGAAERARGWQPLISVLSGAGVLAPEPGSRAA